MPISCERSAMRWDSVALVAPMTDFFDTVDITTPSANAAVASPVHVQATTSNSVPVYAMQIYVDDVLRYHVSGSKVDASVPISPGRHHVVVQSWDTAGGIHKRGIYVRVESQAAVVTSPAPNAVISSPVRIRAVGGSSPVHTMRIYADGTLERQIAGNGVNTALTLKPGKHQLLLQAINEVGGAAQERMELTVAQPSITVLSPGAGASVHSPIQMWATTQDPTRVYAVQVYADSVLRYEMTGTGLNAPPALSLGPHHVLVQALDMAGAIYKKNVDINVLPVKVAVSSPLANSTMTSPVRVQASVPSASNGFHYPDLC
jgi:hypothetical protein